MASKSASPRARVLSASSSGLSCVWGNVPGSIGAAVALGAALATAEGRGGGGGIAATEALSGATSDGGSAREQAKASAAIIARPGFGGFEMKSIFAVFALASVLACDPPPQGAQEISYENGYAQTGPRQTTYQNGYAQQGHA
jgi:hypothetical protein